MRKTKQWYIQNRRRGIAHSECGIEYVKTRQLPRYEKNNGKKTEKKKKNGATEFCSGSAGHAK